DRRRLDGVSAPLDRLPADTPAGGRHPARVAPKVLRELVCQCVTLALGLFRSSFGELARLRRLEPLLQQSADLRLVELHRFRVGSAARQYLPCIRVPVARRRLPPLDVAPEFRAGADDATDREFVPRNPLPQELGAPQQGTEQAPLG